MTLQLLLTSTNWVNLSIVRRANNFQKQIPFLVMERRKMLAGTLTVKRPSVFRISCAACLFTCLGTNEKFSADEPKPVRLQGFNDCICTHTYTERERETERQRERNITSIIHTERQTERQRERNIGQRERNIGNIGNTSSEYRKHAHSTVRTCC
jgi:hypothetical protein